MSGRRVFAWLLVVGSIHPLFAQHRIRMLDATVHSLGDARQLEFTPNRGQLSDQYQRRVPDVLFTTQSRGVFVGLTKNSMRFIFRRVVKDSNTPFAVSHMPLGRPQLPDVGDSVLFYRMDVEFLGSSPNVQIEALDTASDFTNFYLPQHPGGLRHVPAFCRLIYHNLYKGIDMVVYSRTDSTQSPVLMYDFVVRPGAKPERIRLRYVAADSIIPGNGSVRAVTPLGFMDEGAPHSFIKHGESEVLIPSRYRLSGNILSFRFGLYDRTQTLVIDPARAWGTYYGNNWTSVSSVAVDNGNNILLDGWTGGDQYIASPGSYQSSNPSGYDDAYVAKLDSLGRRVWGTYFGGPKLDMATGLAVDSANNVIIDGMTQDTSGIATPGAYQTTYNGDGDLFVAKFDSSGGLIWATYFGGSDYEEQYSAHGLAVDRSGNIYFTGGTNSATNIATAGAFQTSNHATPPNFNAFLAKFDAKGNLQWSTYLGNQDEAGGAVAVDHSGNVILVGGGGGTAGIATPGAFQTAYGGGPEDGFIAKFDGNGTRRWCTFYGGNNDDIFEDVTIDASDNIYAVGTTASMSSIASPGAFQPTKQATQGDSTSAFLVKLSATGARQWATYYCSDSEETGYGVGIIGPDVMICGRTSSPTGLATPGGFEPLASQNRPAGMNSGYCAYLASFSANGSRTWGTYYGGLSMFTSCATGFATCGDRTLHPILAGESFGAATDIASVGAFDTINWRSLIGFLAKFCNGLPFSPPISSEKSTICYGQSDTLTLGYAAGTSEWFLDSTHLLGFDDSSRYITPDTLSPGLHWYYAYTTTGDACATYADSALITVVAGPSVTAGKSLTMCSGDSEQLLAHASGTGPLHYTWAPSSGLSNSRIANPRASPDTTTKYIVTVTDESGCGFAQDSLVVTVNQRPNLGTGGDRQVCRGSSTLLAANVLNDSAYTIRWTPAVGLSNDSILEPTASPDSTVVYHVTVSDRNGCEATDSVRVIVDDSLVPVIMASGPPSVCSGDSILLRTTAGYSSYAWSNGATDSAIEVSAPGSYRVTVTNGGGCSGTSSPIEVSVEPKPLVRLTSSGPTTFCEGDSVALSATPGYHYTWWNGSTKLPDTLQNLTIDSSGSYSVTVTNDAGCDTTTAPLLVTTLSSPVPSIIGPGSVCDESAVTYAVFSALSATTIQWQIIPPTLGTITTGQGLGTMTVQWGGSGHGTLAVTLTTAAGCSGTDSIPITIDSALSPRVSPNGFVALCPGDSVTLDAGTGYSTYQWLRDSAAIPAATNETLTVNQEGTYTVFVTSADGCSGTSMPLAVTVYPPPAKPGITQTGSVLQSTPAVHYQWSLNGTALRDSTAQTIAPDTDGFYRVTITDTNGCSSTSDPYPISTAAWAVVSVPRSTIAVPGDTIAIPLTLDSAHDLAEAGATQYVARIGLDPTMLTPIRPPGTRVGTEWLVALTGATPARAGLLQTLMVLALDSGYCSDLTIDTFYFPGAPVAVTDYSGQLCLNGPCTPVIISSDTAFTIKRIWPNPTEGSFTIAYHVAADGPLLIELEDCLGRTAAILHRDWLQEGDEEQNYSVQAIPSGVYRLVLCSGSRTLSTTIVISK